MGLPILQKPDGRVNEETWDFFIAKSDRMSRAVFVWGLIPV